MNSKPKTSVLIIDDHPVVQMGLVSFINRNKLFNETYTASTGREAINIVKTKMSSGLYDERKAAFDLVIADINLPDFEISTLIEKIKFLLKDNVRILILSMESPLLYIGRLLELGIMGYLDKSASDEELIFAINSIRNKRKYFSGDIVMSYMNEGPKQSNDILSLSSRESEILSLLLKGKTVSGICETLNLHKSSVATYKARIFEKLNVSNLMQLFQLGVKQNLIKVAK